MTYSLECEEHVVLSIIVEKYSTEYDSMRRGLGKEVLLKVRSPSLAHPTQSTTFKRAGLNEAAG